MTSLFYNGFLLEQSLFVDTFEFCCLSADREHLADVVRPGFPEPFQITGTGRYRMRCGRTAIVTGHDAGDLYPWSGVIEDDPRARSVSWKGNGLWLGLFENDYDIVARLPDLPVPPEPARDRFVCGNCEAQWVTNYRFCPSCGERL